MTLPLGTKAVNLGWGSTFAPGWINIDNSPNARLSKIPGARPFLRRIGVLSEAHYRVNWPKDVIIRDLRKPLPFADGSIDYVYASHLLEHLSRHEARQLLHELLRVLKPGGIVRLLVPDLSIEARDYLDALAANPHDDTAAPAFLERMRLSRGGRNPHLWMYDAPSFRSLLKDVGFTDVEVCAHQQGKVPNIDILDNRPDVSLRMEGARPGHMQ
ncbi:MAG: class I SAM-dependent methyltransferase [Thermomicrobiales bacterium]